MLIQCPNCQKTIPATNQTCQFCQNPIPANLRAAPTKTNFKHSDDSLEAGSGLPAEKVWRIYNGLAWFWIITAGFNILSTIIYSLQKADASFLILASVGIFLNLVTILCGTGLLLRWEFIRNIVTTICVIKVLFGLFGLLGSTMSIIAFGFFGVLAVISQLFDLAISCGLIWAISETERLIKLNYLDRLGNTRK
jgi:hypothetical protein